MAQIRFYDLFKPNLYRANEKNVCCGYITKLSYTITSVIPNCAIVTKYWMWVQLDKRKNNETYSYIFLQTSYSNAISY